MTTGEGQRLDPIDTLASLYLIAPLFAFFCGFVRLQIAIPACALIAFQVYEMIRGTAWRRAALLLDRNTAWFALLALASLAWLYGLGGLRQNGDWYKHYAVFNLLARYPWPPAVHLGTYGDLALRYCVGWYLIPALGAKLIGVQLSQLALFAWTALGLLIFFRLLPDLIGIRWASVAAPLLFIAFGGADFVGRLLMRYPENGAPFLEWWAGWAQYSANITALSWVPQHALPAWLGAALLMRQRTHAALLPFLALLMSAVLLWSPFSAIGLVPFLCVLVARHGLGAIALNWRAVAAVLLLALPVGLFLVSGSGKIPHGFIGSVPCVADLPCFSWRSYGLFVVIEVGLPLAILFLKNDEQRPFLLATALSLCLIPLYRLGYLNDFAMRASLPALAVLSILCIRRIANGPLPHTIGLLAVLLLALPEVYLGLSMPIVFPVDVPPTTMFGEYEMRSEVVEQYFTPQPLWLLRNSENPLRL